MQHSRLGVVLVAALEVVFRVHGHIRGGHLYVAVVRDVHAGRVVHLVVGAGGNGETRHRPLAMVEDGIHVGREHRLVFVVHLNGRIGPPQECLRQRRAVAHASLNLKVGAARPQREACHALLVEHSLHLVYPYRHRAVLVFHNVAVGGQVCRRAVVLRPVKLYAARNPRSRQSHQRRLDDMVVIHEVAPPYFVVGHLYSSAELRQHHHLYIFVLQEHGHPFLVRLLVAYRLYHRIGIYHARRTLIHSLLQKDGVLLRLSDLIRRNCHDFSPSLYHFFSL